MFKMPSPHANYWVADVCDIADLHILAMENKCVPAVRAHFLSKCPDRHDLQILLLMCTKTENDSAQYGENV